MVTPSKKCKTVEEPDPTFCHPETVRALTKKLLESRKSCDFFLVVGPECERIGAHKLILGGRSPVFEDLFSKRTAEDSDQEENEIGMPQEEPSTVHLFLEYVYADVFSGKAVEAGKLLHLAQFFDVQPLVKLCEKVLAKPFPVDDVLQIFTAGQKYSLPEVVTHAAELMANHFSKLSTSPTFDQADEAILIYLLEREDLVIEEHKLFSAILQWGDKQIENSKLDPKPSREEVLKNLFPLIRFPTMTAKEFAATVVPTNALPPQTALDILVYINSDEEKRKELSSSIPYNKTPRRGVPFQMDLYRPCSRPGKGTYPAAVLRKQSYIRDMLNFTFCESAGNIEKGLKTRIVSLVLQAPRFNEPIFGNSAGAAADMKFPIEAAISLCLNVTNPIGVKQLVRVGEEAFVKIGQEKMELTLDRPWELSSNKAHTIVLRTMWGSVYTVPNVLDDGSYKIPGQKRDEKFDFFNATTLRDKVSHGFNGVGTVELSNLTMSGNFGSGPVPSASEVPNHYSTVQAVMSSGLHLLRSVKIAFA